MSNTIFEDPSATRLGVERLAGDIVIKIPSSKNWLPLLILSVWLCGWTIGGFAAMSAFFSGTGDAAGRAFLSVWLLGWLVAELGVSWTLLWSFFGYEQVRLSLQRMELSKVLFVKFQTKNYQPNSISNMRWNASAKSTMMRMRNATSAVSGVQFEYGPKTITFGKGVDQGEADFIMEQAKRLYGDKVLQS